MNITDKMLEVSNEITKLVREYTFVTQRMQLLETKFKEYLESKELLEDFQGWLAAEEAKDGQK